MYSAGVLGIDGYVITVESAVGPGLPGLRIVGQIDGPLHDAGMRVTAALGRCGVALPRCKQIVNLGPAEQRKDGTGVDLAIACALLVSHGVIPADSLAGVMLWGELAPDGSLRPPVDTLIAAETARREGFRVLALPNASAREAALIAGLDLLLVPDLSRLIAHLRGEATLTNEPVCVLDHGASRESMDDLVDIRDPLARLALEVMIAGGHPLLVHGPHGSGKTSLTRQVAGLLDEVGDEDALVLTKLQAKRSPIGELVRVPQVRIPDPSASVVELLGGKRPGEVSLAHQGVLVLDELHEFSRDCVRGVRFAMEDKAVAFAGARFPAGFRLLATTRRCPCGWLGHPERACVDGPGAIRRFLARIPQPLLDHVDLVVPLAVNPRATTMAPPRGEVRRRIALARHRQRERLAGMPWRCNAEIPASGAALEQLIPRTPAAEHLLITIEPEPDRRALRRLCRVARTIADLDLERDPAEPIDVDTVELASQLRRLPVVPVGEPRSIDNAKRRQLVLPDVV
ncbi:ATP-binding protein [Nannocystaceae bacterium ST9]